VAQKTWRLDMPACIINPDHFHLLKIAKNWPSSMHNHQTHYRVPTAVPAMQAQQQSRQISAMRANKRDYPMFEKLRGKMQVLLAGGGAQTLEEAYYKAAMTDADVLGSVPGMIGLALFVPTAVSVSHGRKASPSGKRG
jgi:hypothetical protein